MSKATIRKDILAELRKQRALRDYVKRLALHANRVWQVLDRSGWEDGKEPASQPRPTKKEHEAARP